jgi:hypothetical protein
MLLSGRQDSQRTRPGHPAGPRPAGPSRSRDLTPSEQRDLFGEGGAGREGVVELPLLVAAWQASALERWAHRTGRTTGQLLRDLVADGLRHEAATGWHER